MTLTPTGDVPVDVEARVFTLRDASFLTRVPWRSIRNWKARDIARDLGHKDDLTGKWYFSIMDALRLSVMHDLCVRPGLDFGPARAATMADLVARSARENLAQPRDGYRPNLNICVCWKEDGSMFAVAADIKKAGHYYPPVSERDGADYSPLRRAIIAIPASAMMSDLIIRTEFLQARNKRAERPTHD